MSGLVPETYKLGQKLEGVCEWDLYPATLAHLEDAEDVDPFVVKVAKKEDGEDASPEFIMAIIGALIMKKKGELDFAMMIIGTPTETGHDYVLEVDLKDIYLINCRFRYPKKMLDGQRFNVEAIMDHYSRRP